MRTGFFEGKNRIDSLITELGYWGASAVTIHGRSRQQRYSKLANWDCIYQCARKAPDVLPVLGNGDVFSYLDWNRHKADCPELATCMIARGALIKVCILKLTAHDTPPSPPNPTQHTHKHLKACTFVLNFMSSLKKVELKSVNMKHCALQPWIFTEIKEQRHWDISSGERLNILKDFVRIGLEHWGSDTKGISYFSYWHVIVLSY